MMLQAQQISSTAIGYQEFTTNITGTAGDAEGNIYYIGIFKGELRINSNTTVTGQGGNDIFLIKTNSAGTLLWYKTWGNAEDQSVSGIHFLNGSLYLTAFSANTLQLDQFSFTPYANTIGVRAFCKINALNGNIQWAVKNSLVGTSVTGTAGGLHLRGSATGYLRWRETQLLDSLGSSRFVFMRIDTSNGNVLSLKKITGVSSLLHSEQLSPGRYFMALRTSNTVSFQVEDETINLPASGNYLIFLKTDTALRNTTHRIMNPSGVSFQLGATRQNIAFPPAMDSIYMVINSNSSADNIFYTLDGYNQSLFRRNALVVLDTQFVTARLHVISSHPATSNPISYKAIATVGNDLFLFGQVSGNNQAPPLVPLADNVVNLNLLPGFTDTFNLEGPGRSFVLKTDPAFSKMKIKWLGAHTPYETNTLQTSYWFTNGTRHHFGHSNDNVWNPWSIDSALNILSGSMVPNADRADETRFTSFLSDGSLIIAGNSHGKTLQDRSADGIGMGSSRRDFFIAKRTTVGTISWYKRIFSSFTMAIVNRLVVHNDRVYAFINFSGGTNKAGSNYIKLDTTTLIAGGTSFRALAIFDQNGKTRLIPLDANLGSGALVSADIYANGDIAAISVQANIALQLGSRQFPGNQGFYIMRLDSAGNIKNALKVYRTASIPLGATPLQASSVKLMNTDSSLLVTGAYSMLPAQSNYTMYIHDGNGIVDSITAVNQAPAATASAQHAFLLRTNFIAAQAKTVIGPGAGVNGLSAGQFGGYPTFTFSKFQNLPLKVNSNIVLNDTLNHSGIMQLNTDGSFRRIKTWSMVQRLPVFQPSSAKIIGNDLYISGTLNRAAVFDTIAVGSEGFNDALTLRYDTSLRAKQSYRLATNFYESMYDVDVYADSIYAFAYTAQEAPKFYSNRVTAANPMDRAEDAFVGLTVINNIFPLPPVNVVRNVVLYPNPNNGQSVGLFLKEGAGGQYRWRLTDIHGREIAQGSIVLNNAGTAQLIFSKTLPTGQYLLQLIDPAENRSELVRFVVVAQEP